MRELPMKTRILHYAIKKDEPFTLEDIMKDLKNEYGNESQFNEKRVSDYLATFVGVKIMKAKDMNLDENGKLHIKYVVTPYGMQKEKYLRDY